MKRKSLKPLWIVLIVIAALVLLAVVVGILNALIGKGEWLIGWQNYRYDETGYQVGGGTVYQTEITELDISWVTGGVEVTVSEDDAYVSLSETSQNELDETAQLRWKVDENGKLTVKWRKSAWYLQAGMPKKQLTVRIPSHLAQNLTDLEVTAVSAPVAVTGLETRQMELTTVSGGIHLSACRVQQLELTTVSGSVTAEECAVQKLEAQSVSGALELAMEACPARTEIETVSGPVKLTLPADASFRLGYKTVSGKLVSDFALTQQDGEQICGTGDCKLDIATTGGGLTLVKK